MDTVDRLVRMLDEERERNRVEIENLKQMLSTAAGGRYRAERDRDHAEAKVDEWITYSSSWHPLIPKRRLKELEASIPKPYKRELPF